LGPLFLALLATLSNVSELRAQERGFLGINLECQNCRQEQRGDVVTWWFTSPPQITWMREGGPADRAGLQEGDVILSVRGIEITSEEGGRVFGSLRSGEPTEFRVQRSGDEVTLMVTPGTPVEAFGEEYAVVLFPDRWDSVKVQLKKLYEGQLQLQIALRQAEVVLQRTEAEAQRRSGTEAQRAQATAQRAQIDSMRRKLDEWQREIRMQADSLAVRSLKVMPGAVPDVQVEIVAPEERTVTVYSNAVAGARFEVLDEGSPLVSELPDVDGGLLIVKVIEDTPAYAAGLRQGDVVFAVDGVPVRDVKALRKLLVEKREAELTYARKGKKQTCTIGSK
jgi:membrane-associated protease RseP (regulator of RpoE activity)